MKSNQLLRFPFYILFLLSFTFSTTILGQGKGGTGFLSSGPFAELAAQVQTNTANIALLQESTAQIWVELDAIKTEMAAMDSRIDQNQEDIKTLELKVAANKNSILDIYGQMEAAAGELITLRQDVQANQAAIAASQADIAGLMTGLENAVAELNATYQAMSQKFKEIDSALAQMGLKVAEQEIAIMAQISGIQDQINTIHASVQALEGSLDMDTLGTALLNTSILGSEIQKLTVELGNLRSGFETHRHSMDEYHGAFAESVQVGLETVEVITYQEIIVEGEPHTHVECSWAGCKIITHRHQWGEWVPVVSYSTVPVYRDIVYSSEPL